MNSNYKTGLLRIFLIFVVLVRSLTISFGQTIDRKAILVMDIQENLVNPNSGMHIDTSRIDLLFCNLNRAISKLYDEGAPVLYVVNEWTNLLKNWGTGDVCKKGGKGVGLDKRLLMVNDVVYSKSKPNALSNNDLLKYLKDNRITKVYIVGLFAEACVKATVKGLIKEKFNVVVVEDALGSKSYKNKAKVIEYLHKNGIPTIKSREI